MKHQNPYYDSLETRSPEEREKSLLTMLPLVLTSAKRRSSAYRRMLEKVNPQEIISRAALASLPIIKRDRILHMQIESSSLGGVVTRPLHDFSALHMTDDGILIPEDDKRDFWRLGRALYAAGLRSDMILHNAYSYHLNALGWMVHRGARALDCALIPAGSMPLERQITILSHLKAGFIAATIDDIEAIGSLVDQGKVRLPELRHAFVIGTITTEARARLESRGMHVASCIALPETGLIAYETQGGGMIIDDQIIVEVLRHGRPAPRGETGELVVTSSNPDMPLIRFATGILSCVLKEPSPCGRTNMRIAGPLGLVTEESSGQSQQPLRKHPPVRRRSHAKPSPRLSRRQ